MIFSFLALILNIILIYVGNCSGLHMYPRDGPCQGGNRVGKEEISYKKKKNLIFLEHS